MRFPCVHAAATTPVQRLGVLLAHLTQPCQPSPEGSPGRPAHRPFRGLLGVHSRCGLHTRAVTVFRDPLSEGFRHFVSSMPAPVASGWSGCRVGLAPTGKRRLVTAHTHCRHSHRISAAPNPLRSRCARYGAKFLALQNVGHGWPEPPQRLLEQCVFPCSRLSESRHGRPKRIREPNGEWPHL